LVRKKKYCHATLSPPMTNSIKTAPQLAEFMNG
jgi:hypothetical protein